MTSKEIDILIGGNRFSLHCPDPKLIETHISWVILCGKYVYKIKKPIHYSFLNFSTLERRLFYCREEIRLNWRLTFNVYLSIVEVRRKVNSIELGGEDGEVIDYAIKMRRLDSDRQMDVLLANNLVDTNHIKDLAERIATFHQKARVITNKDIMDLAAKFDDLEKETPNLNNHLGAWAVEIVKSAISQSNRFLKKHQELLASRLKQGYYRDVHGDLHSRNIFLLHQPVIFDCIEFNEDYRQIDILNEIAFLCMDLDSFEREDLSGLFLKYYFDSLHLSPSQPEWHLFTYYKAYRANIRAKVNSLRGYSAENESDRETAWRECKKYLHLMDRYFNKLNQ